MLYSRFRLTCDLLQHLFPPKSRLGLTKYVMFLLESLILRVEVINHLGSVQSYSVEHCAAGSYATISSTLCNADFSPPAQNNITYKVPLGKPM